MDDAFAQCENLVREADKDRYLAALFAPAERRRQLYALYAFNVEVGRIRELSREPMPGEIRLQWWRDVLESSGAGAARSHPTAAALIDTVVRARLPIGSLVDLIDARAFDVYNEPMATLADLETYARRTSSVLIELAARILGADASEAGRFAQPAGIAYAIAGLLRAFALHAARGQLYVPLDVLARHGARREDALAGRATPPLYAALAEMRAQAREQLDKFRALGTPPALLLPALLAVALVPLYLDRMERRDYDPFRTPVEVAQWRRQWTLWRAARDPQRIF